MVVRPATFGEDLDGAHRADPMWWGSRLFWEQTEALAREHPCFDWCVDDADGRPVGHAGFVSRATRLADQASGLLWVAPHARHRGAGTALRETLTAAASEDGFRTVMLKVPESDPDGVAVARRWGARNDGHHFESTLDLRSVSDRHVAQCCSKALSAGVSLEGVEDEAALVSLFPFARDRFFEAPDMGEASEGLVLEEFLALVGTSANVVVARRAGPAVGISWVVHRSDDGPTANTYFTGVVATERGLGIATALKAHQAQQLRERGYTTLVTQNLDGNAPILSSNARLGFQRGPGWFDYILPTASSDQIK